MDRRRIKLRYVRAIKLALVLILFGFSTYASAATVAVWEDDDPTKALLGFDNFEFSGTSYNLRFEVNSCVNLFTDCDNPQAPYSFEFYDPNPSMDPNNISGEQLNSKNFRNALYADQMINTALVTAKDNDNLPGCTFGSGNDCIVYIPYSYDPNFPGEEVVVWYWLIYDSTGGIGGDNSGEAVNNAIWYPDKEFVVTYLNIYQTSPIPVPAAVWFLVSGIVGMGFFSRRKKLVG